MTPFIGDINGLQVLTIQWSTNLNNSIYGQMSFSAFIISKNYKKNNEFLKVLGLIKSNQRISFFRSAQPTKSQRTLWIATIVSMQF